jgi:hypothetical protein
VCGEGKSGAVHQCGLAGAQQRKPGSELARLWVSDTLPAAFVWSLRGLAHGFFQAEA